MSEIDNQTVKLYNKTRKLFRRKYLCYAPFLSLRFNQEGFVSPCCHTYNYRLGDFNSETILDIWNGRKINDLRASIINRKLNFGCVDCKAQIANKNFYAVEARKYDILPYIPKYPAFFEIQTSNRCNLACIMCKPQNSNQITSELYKNVNTFNNEKFLNELNFFIPHLKLTHFCGGEPFIEEKYFEMWQKLIKGNSKIRIDITSNITILNDKTKKLLEKGNFNINVSIDSFKKDTFEKIRRNADFDKVMTNFKYIQDYHKKRGKSVNLNICPITENWEEIPAIIDFCNKNEILVKINNVTHPSHLSLFNLSVDELKNIYSFYAIALDNIKYNKAYIVRNNINNFKAFIERIKNQYEKKSVKNEVLSKEQLINNIKVFILSEMKSLTALEKGELLQKYLLKIETFFKIIETKYPEKIKPIMAYISGIDIAEIIFSAESKNMDEIIKDILFEI